MGTITWFTGNTQAGKTTLAEALRSAFEKDGKTVYVIDGDVLRAKYKTKLGFSKADRWKNNLNAAEMAVELQKEYDHVLVAVICPYKTLRKKVKKLTKCKFVYIEGGKVGEQYPYDHPNLY